MHNMTLNSPLTDAEFDWLDDFLLSIDGDCVMDIEILDGFFAALICCPSVVMPSEYFPHILGEEFTFTDDDQAKKVFNLLLRHWNFVADELRKTLTSDHLYMPVLLEDDDGIAHGNNWAIGFMLGVAMRPADWKELLNDLENAICLTPIMMLAHENDTDLTLRTPTIPPEKREEMLGMMLVSIRVTYLYFHEERTSMAGTAATVRRSGHKVGRNEACPCGSGKKYKHCCGGATPALH